MTRVALALLGTSTGRRARAVRPAWEDAWSAVFCSQHPDLTGEALQRYMQLATLNCIPASAAKAAGAAH